MDKADIYDGIVYNRNVNRIYMAKDRWFTKKKNTHRDYKSFSTDFDSMYCMLVQCILFSILLTLRLRMEKKMLSASSVLNPVCSNSVGFEDLNNEASCHCHNVTSHVNGTKCPFWKIRIWVATGFRWYGTGIKTPNPLLYHYTSIVCIKNKSVT